MLRIVRPNPSAIHRGGWCGVGYLCEIAGLAGLMLVLMVVAATAIFPQQPQAAFSEQQAPGTPIYAIGFAGEHGHAWINQLFTGVKEFSLPTGELTAEWPSYSRSLCDVARGGREHVTTVLADTVGQLRIIRDEQIVVTYDNRDTQNAISDIDVSADGELVVAAHQHGRLLQWTWNGRSFDRSEVDLPRTIELVRISPDKSRLVLAVNSREVMVRDLQTGSEQPIAVAHDRRMTQLAWMPQGDRFVSGGDDGYLRMWDAATMKLGWETRGDSLAPTSLAISQDGTEIAAGGFDNLVRIWNSADGKLVSSLEGHNGPVRGLAYDPQGHTLISGDLKGHVFLWSRATRHQIRKLM